MCRHDLNQIGDVVPDASWIVCADLVGEPIEDGRPIVALVALRSMIRYRGRPVERDQVSDLARSRQPLILIPTGTVLRAIDVYHWGDGRVPGVSGHATDFALPDGHTVWVTTEARREADDASGVWREGLTWREFACAASVVPLAHPLASDPTACAALVAHIDRRARDAFTSYACSFG